jgi:hypothetical protein
LCTASFVKNPYWFVAVVDVVCGGLASSSVQELGQFWVCVDLYFSHAFLSVNHGPSQPYFIAVYTL